ncbi:MAG TPA: hypothetical protein VF403_28085 [Kofleriaceae bacterium]
MVPLPASSIEPVAAVMAKRYRFIAIIPFACAPLLLATSLPDQLKQSLGSGALMFFVFAVVPVMVGCLALAKAKKVDRIGRVASRDPSLEWRLDSTTVFAYGRPELAFSITVQLERSLRDVPRAVVIR